MNTPLDPSILSAALEGLELQHQRIVAQISQVRAQLGLSAPLRASNGSVAEPKPKRTMSAAGRASIAEAQRKRWAAVKEGRLKRTGSSAKRSAKR